MTGTRATLGALAVIGGAAGAALTAYGRFVEPYRLALERITIDLPTRHRALDGMRIAFVTDIHAGPYIDRAVVERILQAARRERPDLWLFGGDFISEAPRYLREVTPVVRELACEPGFVGYGVLGNHDIFVSAPRTVSEFEDAGLPILRNAHVSVPYRNAKLFVVGIDDTLHGAPDLEVAFAGLPSDDPAVVLWHESEFADHAAARGAILQLSGHSHGGQVRIPGVRPLWAPQHGRRYIAGRHELGDMTLYVSRGAGVYRPPIRLNCPPEVTLVTLRGPVGADSTGSSV
jgi:uncharacterized protein